MNKSILALLLGVCIVGMCLLMYQENQRGQPGQIDAATRGAQPLLPMAQELIAVPGRPSFGRPALPEQNCSLDAAGQTETLLAAKNPIFSDTSPKKTSSAAKITTVKTAHENAGREKMAGEKPALTESTAPEPTAAILPAPTSSARLTLPSPPKPPTSSAAFPDVKANWTPLRGKTQNSVSQKAIEPQQSVKLVVFARDKGATVRLISDKPIRYQTMTLTNPDRLVVDVEAIEGLKAPGVPKNSLVSNVRLGKIDGKTRIVIDLTAKPGTARLILSGEKDTLDVRLDH
ncbi:MAG: AMIN domain-containing protein [Desulfovibrio sp.]|jgi:hypothetical protein|nr:AMIN domain-containing protein [Desulfovibrio sp.]